jgi:hypothetical protein
MKYLILSLFLVLSLHGQAQSTFNKSYYFFGDSTNTLNSIKGLAESDSNIFCLNTVVDSTQSIAITKLDKNGVIIKKMRIENADYNMPLYPSNSFLLDNDGNFLFVCSINYKNGVYPDGFVAKFNSNLDTLWTRIFAINGTIASCNIGGDPMDYFTAIQQTADSGYIVAGNYAYQCDINKQRAFLTKLDKNGNLQWRKVYTNRKAVYDIQVVHDGGFVFTDFMNDDFRINRTDSLGNIIWSDIPNSLVNQASGTVCLDFDSNVIIMAPYVYSHPTPNTYYYGVNVIKYDLESNQQLWDKTYRINRSFDCVDIHNSYEMEVLPSNDLLIAGASHVDSLFYHIGEYKGTVLKINANGDSLWTRYYNPPGHLYNMGQFNDMILTSDGGILAAGYYKEKSYNYNNGAWLVKMDSNGFAPGAQTVSVDNVPSSASGTIIKVYPNPASAEITFDWFTEYPQSGQLKVYNAMGMLVNLYKLESGRTTLNIENLCSGIYFYTLIIPDELVKLSVPNAAQRNSGMYRSVTSSGKFIVK